MDFIVERIDRILKDLHESIYPARFPINAWKIKESDDKGMLDASCDEWEDFTGEKPWGGFRKKFWFRTNVTLPDNFYQQPVEFYITTGAEGGWDANNPQIYFYLDGKLIQGLDNKHRTVHITPSAKIRESHSIAMHAYTSDNDGFLYLKTGLAAVDVSVRKLYYDILTPYQTAILLDKDDKDRIDTLGALNAAINILDLRDINFNLFHDSVTKAIDFLEREFYEKKCGHSEAVVKWVGHSHIDVAWRWTLGVTREKAARTFSGMLALSREYPEFIFNVSQPQNLLFVKEDEPELYNDIKNAVRTGRFDPEGAMFLEADCNLTSGESLARQLLYGKMFFRDEFGIESKILWLPDVFGYSAALPQLLKKSGVDYFMTTKISWNEYNKFPYDTFLWQGIDGTKILSHFIPAMEYKRREEVFTTTYNGVLSPGQVKGAWRRYQQKHLNNEVLFAAGYGDGGGGTTEEMLEQARRMNKSIPGCPRTEVTSANSFFQKLEQDVLTNPDLPCWVGELYFELHRGTLTSMARNKKYNRQAEFLLESREKMASMKQMLLSIDYPYDELRLGWDVVMLNQFHDIIPGSSIKEVYEESQEQYRQLFDDHKPALDRDIAILTAEMSINENAVVVFNTSGLSVNAPVIFESGNIEAKCVYAWDDPEQLLPVQKIGDSRYLFFAKDIPANGYKTYYISDRVLNGPNPLIITDTCVETPFYTIYLDENGYLASIFDREAGRQVLSGTGNMLEVYEDRPYNWEAWDISAYYREKRWIVDGPAEIEVLEHGPVRGCIRVKHNFLDSVITQDYHFYAECRRIDFVNHIDWKQQHLLLKACFPVDVYAEEATYEIQYGHLKRPTHTNTSWDAAKFEVCAHKWADLSEEGYGVSLLNDCKYGHDIHNGAIRLTLLKCSTFPNPDADKEVHTFTYSLYPHIESWKSAGVVAHAYALNNPPTATLREAGDGKLPESLSLFYSDKSNVIVEAVKGAENRDGLICRAYESHGRRTKAVLTACKPIQFIEECDIIEGSGMPLEPEGNQLSFEIKPFEIKTFRVRF